MTAALRAWITLGITGLVLMASAPGAQGRTDLRALPLLYAYPARGLGSGSGLVEVAVSSYRLHATVFSAEETAWEESVLSTRLSVAVGLTDRVSVRVRSGIRRFRWTLWSGDREESGAEDTWLGVRLSPPPGESLFRVGLSGMILLPTGKEPSIGRPGDFTTGTTDYSVTALCDLDLSRYFEPDHCVIFFNVGYRWHSNETDGSVVWPDVYPEVPAGESEGFNDQVLLRLGWRYSTPGVILECELKGDQFIHARDLIAVRENPVSLGAGLRKLIRQRYWVRLAGELAISSGDLTTTLLPEPERAYPDWLITASAGAAWGRVKAISR